MLDALVRWFRGTSVAEKRLLHRCGGDSAQLERLIGYELQRRPGWSRAKAAQAALERWNRD